MGRNKSLIKFPPKCLPLCKKKSSKCEALVPSSGLFRLKKPPSIVDMSYYVTNENSFLDIKNAHLRVTGNVHTDVLKLGAIEFQPTGSEVTGTVNFTNVTTGVTTSSNLNVGGTLQLGTVEVVATTHTLANTTAKGNVTPHTIEVSNVTTGLVTTANVEVGRDLVVTGNVAVDTNTLFVDSVNDRVGIGTVSPATKLHVEHYGSAIGDFEGIRIANHATNLHSTSRPAYEFVVSDIDAGTGIGASKFAIGYRGTTSASRTDRLVIDASGNVGIGTTSPAKKLHLHNDDESVYYRLSTTAGGVTDNFDIAQWNSTRSNGNHGVMFINRANTDMRFITNDTERMRIKNDGNVGIGTDSPDGPLHLKLATNSNFTGFTYQTGDVKTVMSNTGDGGTNISILQVYKSVQNRVPSAIDYHSETATASNVYTYCVNPYGGRIGLGTDNPNSDLTMGARIYNTTGFVGLTGTPSKGDPGNTTTTLPYTQYSTTNPATGAAYYFINPYPGEAQCTIVYDNAQTSANGLIYFYQNGPGYQPATTLPYSTVGTSEFTIPLLDTGSIRVNAIHLKPVNGCQIRITAVYWVPFRGVTANIREGGKLVLGTVGGSGTPTGSLSFRAEYEQPTGNQLQPKEKVENGLAWMTDLSTWYNAGLGGNGINWSKGNATYGVSTGARIWFQPESFTSVSSGAAGNHGRLNLSAGYSTGTSNTPDITITSTKRVGIGTTSPTQKLDVNGVIKSNVPSWHMYDTSTIHTGTLNFSTNKITPQNCSVTLSTGRATITVAGRYCVSFHAFTESSVTAGTGCQIKIMKSGVDYVRNYHIQPVTGVGAGPSSSSSLSATGGLTAIMDLAVNDYVEVSTNFLVHWNLGATFSGFMIG